MFKKKSFMNFPIILSIYFNNNLQILTNNNYNNNNINLKFIKNNKIPFNLLNEFNKSIAVDIATTNYNNINISNNYFYNYKYDLYLNIINSNKNQFSQNLWFNNRIWLEREVSEFFPINYLNLKDTRHLILNYNENKYYLIKNISVQNNDELKTSWHLRKINKINNNNIEI